MTPAHTIGDPSQHPGQVFEARLGGQVVESLMHVLVNAVFTHRHHRLRHRFGATRY